MSAKRKANAPLKVPCTDDLYWKLTAEGARHRKGVVEFALDCLKEATKNVKLHSKPAKKKHGEVAGENAGKMSRHGNKD